MRLPFLVAIAALVVRCIAADDNITCDEVVKAFNSIEVCHWNLWDTANSIDTDAKSRPMKERIRLDVSRFLSSLHPSPVPKRTSKENFYHQYSTYTTASRIS